MSNINLDTDLKKELEAVNNGMLNYSFTPGPSDIAELKKDLEAVDSKEVINVDNIVGDRPTDHEIQAESEAVSKRIAIGITKNRKSPYSEENYAVSGENTFNLVRFMGTNTDICTFKNYNIDNDTLVYEIVPPGRNAEVHQVTVYQHEHTKLSYDYVTCESLEYITASEKGYTFNQIFPSELLGFIYGKDRKGVRAIMKNLIDNDYTSIEPKQLPTATTTAVNIPQNDVTRLKLLLELTENDYVYNSSTKNILVYNGMLWDIDLDNEKFLDDATKTGEYILKLTADTDLKDKGIKQYNAYNDTPKRRNLVTEFHSKRPMRAKEFDSNIALLNTPSGTYNLTTAILQPHDKNDYITKCTSGSISNCFKLENSLAYKTLCSSMGNDMDLVNSVITILGYAMSEKNNKQLLFFNNGVGGDGKSTFFNHIKDVLGDYAVECDSNLLTLDKSLDANKPNPELLKLKGSKVCIISELEEHVRLGKKTFKMLTGGDTVSGYYKFGNDCIEFVYHGVIFFNVNGMPSFDGSDKAVTRRIKVIPWKQSFSLNGTQDDNLADKLEADKDNTLSFLLYCLEQYRQQGLYICPKIEEETQQIFKENNTIGRFVEDCTEPTTEPKDRIKLQTVFDTYLAWCKGENIRHTLTKKAFKKELETVGVYAVKDRNLGITYNLKIINYDVTSDSIIPWK